MIAVVQRVADASVVVSEERFRSEIGPGLCVLLGVEEDDTESDATWMAGKIARLRIFRDGEGRMNRSVADVGGSVLLISQFTLAADCSRGNRPSFVAAADPALAERLYELVAQRIREDETIPVRTGRFGAIMQVALTNDGPVTIILRSERLRRDPG